VVRALSDEPQSTASILAPTASLLLAPGGHGDPRLEPKVLDQGQMLGSRDGEPGDRVDFSALCALPGAECVDWRANHAQGAWAAGQGAGTQQPAHSLWRILTDCTRPVVLALEPTKPGGEEWNLAH
jgi:hypothetical protein